LDDHEFLKHADRKGTEKSREASAARATAEKLFRAIPEDERQRMRAAVPPEVLRDAKSTRTAVLEEQLKNGKNFELVGYLIGNKSKGQTDKVGIVVPRDRPANDEDLRKQLENATGWMSPSP
jgi:hypothetical protein